MANIKDFIKKIGNETVSLEEQQRALAAVEQTIVEAKAKREESIGKNVDLVISALKKIESDLEAKLVELNNTPAKQGVAGPKGEKGRDGRDGVDGYKGQDGKDGVDGQDGKDGEDGVSVTDAKVDFDGSLVITLSDGREIDAGTIVSLDVAKNIHSVQTAGTGSTSQAVLDAIAAIQATLATYGTMATQNATAVAITGGTIDNATVGATTATTGAFTTLTSTGGALNGTIGATTPAAGTFTTITGQTEVLKGTGSNLIKQSQTIGTSPWNQVGTATAAINSSGTTDPLGGNTASLITTATDIAYNGNAITQLNTVSGNIAYTYSVYIKAGTATTMQIALRDNSTGSLPTTTLTPTSSWQRVSVSLTSGSGTSSFYAILGGANGTFYAWGAQLEIGSTTNTYIPTTTTAVYGTPTLSFSGVAGLGLQSDGSLYVSPAGTGALQAQATTSSTVGGNARGANAVDWQTKRNAASQVASGLGSVICGGEERNTASGQQSFVGTGYNNNASAYGATIVSGVNNSNAAIHGFIGAGNAHTIGSNGSYNVLVGGNTNTANGRYNFIGGGTLNSGTSGTAVTSQATTAVTSGSTAVTLSGSNANIKVGQLINGTGISENTYVSAISGTSLTLTQNATSTGTPTLVFYTPHGVVVGGGNNQATGSYSFIGGGGDAGTAANRNVASGAWSFIGGGAKNVASGAGSVICGGGTEGGGSYFANTASGSASFIGGGLNNTAGNTFSTVGGGASNNASGYISTIVGGTNNVNSGTGSTIFGGNSGSTRGLVASYVFPAYTPLGGTGTSQSALLVLAVQTTDATATALRSDSSAAGSTNQVILPNNSAYFFTGEVVSGVTGGGDTKGWTIEGVIKRGAGVGTTALVGTPTVTSMYADLGAATWTIAVTADTTNGGIRVTFTGQASTTIRTVCRISTVEMTF